MKTDVAAVVSHGEARLAASYLLIDKLADPMARDSYNLIQRYVEQSWRAEERAEGIRHAWQRDMAKGREFVAEAESLRAELAIMTELRQGTQRHCTNLEDELRKLRSELSALRTAAAPSVTLLACRWCGADGIVTPADHHCGGTAYGADPNNKDVGRYENFEPMSAASGPVAEKGTDK